MDTRTRALLMTPLLLALLVAVGACSGGSGSDAAGGNTQFSAGQGTAQDSSRDAGGEAAQAPTEDGVNRSAVTERAVISTGDVQLRADDVAEARDEVERVVDRHFGEITEERTESDHDGEMERTRMVVRVPSEDFAETMDELSEIADLRSATSKAEDVTTQVIDTEVRVRAQERSLRRVEQLLARAASLRDIVAIEAQLTRRQAELDSLKAQQAYLADRTSLGTITVTVDRAEDEQVGAAEAEGSGFGAGLAAGWSALKAFGTGLATVAGAVLPWLVLLSLVGLPLALLGRRLSARRTARTPSAG